MVNTQQHRRVQRELEKMVQDPPSFFASLRVSDENIMRWDGLLLPTAAPYSKGAFRVELQFPLAYPFKPPSVQIRTPIYHPNVDEEGRVCLDILTSERWRPHVWVKQVLKELLELVDQPRPHSPLRAELAAEMVNHPADFHKKAKEHTKQNSEKRP